jgi:hypothetical protein
MGAPDEVVLLACWPTRRHTMPYAQPQAKLSRWMDVLGFVFVLLYCHAGCLLFLFSFFPYGGRCVMAGMDGLAL